MKWLHLSDIHYNPRNDGRSTHQLRTKLPRYIAENHIEADYLFITGDFRNAKYQNSDDYVVASEAVRFILEIADAAKIPYINIHIVPGNHDLTRTEDINRLRRIKENYNANDGRFQDDDSDLFFLLERFHFYRQIVYIMEKYGVPTHQVSGLYQLHGVHYAPEFSLLYLNTCIICNSDNDRGNLIIGNFDIYQCLEEIKREYPDRPIIVLAHHGIENFRPDERNAVERLFKDYPIKLYLCGDAHKPWQRTTNNILELTMGGLIQGNNVRTVFSVGEQKNEKYLIKAYEWDADTSRWGEYTQLNEELRDELGDSFLDSGTTKVFREAPKTDLASHPDSDCLHKQLCGEFKAVREHDGACISSQAILLAKKLWNEYQDEIGGIYLLDLARIQNNQKAIEEIYFALSISTDARVRTLAKRWNEKWRCVNEHF